MQTSAPARSVTSQELSSRLRLAVARLARRLRQATAGDDVTATQLAVLSTLDRLGPLTLGELAGVEQVQPPTMTRVVARLEELGFVTRAVDTADRRVARASLTGAGRRYVAGSRTRRNAYLAERLKRLTPDERDLVAAALPLLERLVEDDR